MLAVAEARAFDQHRRDGADARRQRARQRGGAGFAQARRALVDDVAGNLRHARRRRARPGAVGEDVQVVERGFLDQRQRVGEHGPALGRESRDEVGAERDARPQAARAAARGERVGAAVPARHALQHEVVAGLDREMEMRHEARLLAHQTPEIVVDLHRIERGEAQPLERRHQYQQPAHELPQARPPRQIGAEAGDVDAGQHDLAMAERHQRARLLDDVADRHRAVVAAPLRDDAEGAAVVAALLHLDDGAGAAVDGVDELRRRRLHRADVADQHARRSRGIALALELCLVAEYLVDFRHGGVALGTDLRGAAGDDEPGIGPRAAGAADRLARLALGLGGHRAGVDDHRIVEAGRRGLRADHLGFEGVEPAAESNDVEFPHFLGRAREWCRRPLDRQFASFDRLRMRACPCAIRDFPHPEPVEGRKSVMQRFTCHWSIAAI